MFTRTYFYTPYLILVISRKQPIQVRQKLCRGIIEKSSKSLILYFSFNTPLFYRRYEENREAWN